MFSAGGSALLICLSESCFCGYCHYQCCKDLFQRLDAIEKQPQLHGRASQVIVALHMPVSCLGKDIDMKRPNTCFQHLQPLLSTSATVTVTPTHHAMNTPGRHESVFLLMLLQAQLVLTKPKIPASVKLSQITHAFNAARI